LRLARSGRRSRPESKNPDELRLPGLAVPDKDVTAGSYLSIDKLVQGNRTVGYIGLRQGCPLLKALEVLPGLWNQGDCNPLGRLGNPLAAPRTGNILASGTFTRASSGLHTVQDFFLWMQQIQSASTAQLNCRFTGTREVTEIRRHIIPASERRLPCGIRKLGPGR
jgi:hypothetical protein